MNVLPDSRSQQLRNGQYRGGMWWVPIYCANCGGEGGLVPEDTTNFVFYLCNDCFALCGEITNTYVMPDEVFWEKVKQEQVEKYGRYLTQVELERVVAEDASPLATLIKQRR